MSTEQRKQAVNAAIGSVRLEGLNPSKASVDRLDRYASGKISATQMRSEAVAEVRRTAPSR